MSTDAAAVFAQVIPALMIATFLSDMRLERVPPILRGMLFWVFAIAVIGEGTLLYSLAIGETLSSQSRSLVLLSVFILLTFLTVMVGARFLVKYDDGAKDPDDQQREQ